MIERAIRISLSPRLASVLLSSVVIAQTVGASLQGIVTDPTGSRHPGADVVVIATATGGTWELKTDSSGRYRVPVLQPGEYEVHVSQTGFQPIARRGIQLTVGQNAVIDLKIDLGRIAEEMTVSGTSPTINVTSGSVSGLVSDKEIRELPLNGRSFQQLALLQTGVTPALAAGNDVVGGRAPKISINGARPEQNSFLLDGTDINNVYNKTPGSSAVCCWASRRSSSFRCSPTRTRRNSADRPAASSTPSRDRARTRFTGPASSSTATRRSTRKTSSIRPTSRSRISTGISSAASRRTDRQGQDVYFAAFESLIERLGVTGVTAVPDDNARLGILPTGAVTLHPAIPLYLSTLFPRANGRSLGGGGAEYLFTQTQPTDEYFGQIRVDHRFSGGGSLFARYTFDDGKVDRVPPNKPPVSITKEHSTNQYLTVEHQHLFTPALLNTLKGGINRSVSLADNVRTIDIPSSLAWLPGENFGYLTITGLVTEMAGDFRLPRNDYLTNWQLGDTLFWTRGSHAARFGFQSQLLQFHQNTTSQQGGIVTFPNLSAFSARRAEQHRLRGAGADRSNSRLQAMALRILRAGRRPAALESVAQSRRPLRVHHHADRSERQAVESAERHRFDVDHRRTVALESVAEERGAAARHRVGSAEEGDDVGARRLRLVLRRDPAEVLLLLRQPQPAVHHPHDDREPAVSERDGELRSEGADQGAAADDQLRPRESVHHPVQPRRAAGAARRLGRLRRLRRVAWTQPAAARRREPGAGNDRQRGQDVPGHHPAQSGVRPDFPAHDRRRVVLRLAAAQPDETALARRARAVLVHVREVD
jgi:hypothetical protein